MNKNISSVSAIKNNIPTWFLIIINGVYPWFTSFPYFIIPFFCRWLDWNVFQITNHTLRWSWLKIDISTKMKRNKKETEKEISTTNNFISTFHPTPPIYPPLYQWYSIIMEQIGSRVLVTKINTMSFSL